MNRALSKSGKLRELFESDGVVRIVGAHDGFGAKLVELSGFDGVWASGLEISRRVEIQPLYFDEFCMEIDTIEDLERARQIMADRAGEPLPTSPEVERPVRRGAGPFRDRLVIIPPSAVPQVGNY